MEQNVEWISVSECAKRIGKSEQTVRNNIRNGILTAKEFQRKSMKGFLVRWEK